MDLFGWPLSYWMILGVALYFLSAMYLLITIFRIRRHFPEFFKKNGKKQNWALILPWLLVVITPVMNTLCSIEMIIEELKND